MVGTKPVQPPSTEGSPVHDEAPDSPIDAEDEAPQRRQSHPPRRPPRMLGAALDNPRRTHPLLRGSQVARLYSLQRNPRERCGAKVAIESARDTRRRRDNSVEVRCRRRRRVCHTGPTGLWHRSEGRLEKRSRPRAGEVVSGPAGENWSGCIFLPFLFSFSYFQIPN
jgi:hypothetical protein